MTYPVPSFVDTVGSGRTSTAPFITVIMNRAPTPYDGINGKYLVGQRWIYTSGTLSATITGITNANPAVVTANNVFTVGQIVYIQGVGGMTELNGNSYLITAVTDTQFTISVDSTSFGTYTSGGSASVQELEEYFLLNFQSLSGTVLANWVLLSEIQNDLYLETLSDDLGNYAYPLNGNIQLVGHVNEQGSTKFSTTAAGTHLININPMSSARWIVDPLGFNGTHTTIASAIASATSGDTILLLPGTYTENPTLKAGVNLAAQGGDQLTPNVIILGKATASGAGTYSISNVQLKTNSDYCLVVSGSAATKVILNNCYINANNNTAISYTSSSGSSGITLVNCLFNSGTTGVAIYSNSGSGPMNIYNCNFSNSGASTTASSTSTAAVNFYSSQVNLPLSTTSTGTVSMNNCSMLTNDIATTCITTAGTGTSLVFNSSFLSNGASSISIGSGSTLVLSACEILSYSTYAASGTGTLYYGETSFIGTSSTLDPGLTRYLLPSTPSNATSGYIWTSTGTNTSPTWQAPIVPSFTDWTNYAPTLTGSTSAGTTTYVTQLGRYSKVGNIVTVEVNIAWSAATGTGDMTISLPIAAGTFNIFFAGSAVSSSVTWPSSITQISFVPVGATSTMVIKGSGSAQVAANVQMANTAAGFIGSVTYAST